MIASPYNSIAIILLSLPLLISAAPKIESSDAVSTTGNFRLTWSDSEKGGPYRLEECDAEKCKTIYLGSDNATVMSGRPNGRFLFRISNSETSGEYNELTVVVQHHPLKRALLVLAGGFLLVLACAGAIVAGQLKIRKAKPSASETSI